MRAVLKGGEKLVSQLPSLLDVVGKMSQDWSTMRRGRERENQEM